MEERTLVPLGGMVKLDVVAGVGTLVVAVLVVAVVPDAEPPVPGPRLLRLLNCAVSKLGLLLFIGPGVMGDVAPIED